MFAFELNILVRKIKFKHRISSFKYGQIFMTSELIDFSLL